MSPEQDLNVKKTLKSKESKDIFSGAGGSTDKKVAENTRKENTERHKD